MTVDQRHCLSQRSLDPCYLGEEGGLVRMSPQRRPSKNFWRWNLSTVDTGMEMSAGEACRVSSQRPSRQNLTWFKPSCPSASKLAQFYRGRPRIEAPSLRWTARAPRRRRAGGRARATRTGLPRTMASRPSMAGMAPRQAAGVSGADWRCFSPSSWRWHAWLGAIYGSASRPARPSTFAAPWQLLMAESHRVDGSRSIMASSSRRSSDFQISNPRTRTALALKREPWPRSSSAPS